MINNCISVHMNYLDGFVHTLIMRWLRHQQHRPFAYELISIYIYVVDCYVMFYFVVWVDVAIKQRCRHLWTELLNHPSSTMNLDHSVLSAVLREIINLLLVIYTTILIWDNFIVVHFVSVSLSCYKYSVSSIVSKIPIHHNDPTTGVRNKIHADKFSTMPKILHGMIIRRFLDRNECHLCVVVWISAILRKHRWKSVCSIFAFDRQIFGLHSLYLEKSSQRRHININTTFGTVLNPGYCRIGVPCLDIRGKADLMWTAEQKFPY